MTPRIITDNFPADAPHVPVAIVGAGACGLVAAITLRDADIDCVVLERDAAPQGSTALSSGFIPAAGTRAQRTAGVQDSPELFAQDIQNKAHGTAAAHLVKAFSEVIGPAIDTLSAQHAIEFIVLDGFLYPGHSVRRMHTVPDKTGASLVTQLERAANNAGATLLCNSTVRQLWVSASDDCAAMSGDRVNQAGQRIIGIGYIQPDGSLHHLSCDALILACNGFGGNPQMVRDLLPEMRDAPFAGHAGNDGSAIGWGRALGARLADLGGYQGHGSWAVPQGALISWALMMEGGIQVNAHGQRFHDETLGYSEAAVQVLAQPGGVAWDVFDEPILQLARSFPDFCTAEAAGAVKQFDTVQNMAAWIGCDATHLVAACAIFTGVSGQNASENSKNLPAQHIFKRDLAAPYYAVKVTGALFHTQGGLDIDADCRVLREDGASFPNLLAAGGAARGVSGNAVWGYLSGNGLLSAVAGGTIAAKTAIKQVEKRL